MEKREENLFESVKNRIENIDGFVQNITLDNTLAAFDYYDDEDEDDTRMSYTITVGALYDDWDCYEEVHLGKITSEQAQEIFSYGKVELKRHREMQDKKINDWLKLDELKQYQKVMDLEKQLKKLSHS